MRIFFTTANFIRSADFCQYKIGDLLAIYICKTKQSALHNEIEQPLSKALLLVLENKPMTVYNPFHEKSPYNRRV
jgi:hypothetical protein